MRLSCSGRAFHVAFGTQAQEAFLEGHVLRPGQGRLPWEGRSGRRDWPVPPPSPGARPRSRFAGRAEPADRPGRHPRWRPRLAEQVDEPLDPLDEDVAVGR